MKIKSVIETWNFLNKCHCVVRDNTFTYELIFKNKDDTGCVAYYL